MWQCCLWHSADTHPIDVLRVRQWVCGSETVIDRAQNPHIIGSRCDIRIQGRGGTRHHLSYRARLGRGRVVGVEPSEIVRGPGDHVSYYTLPDCDGVSRSVVQVHVLLTLAVEDWQSEHVSSKHVLSLVSSAYTRTWIARGADAGSVLHQRADIVITRATEIHVIWRRVAGRRGTRTWTIGFSIARRYRREPAVEREVQGTVKRILTTRGRRKTSQARQMTRNLLEHVKTSKATWPRGEHSPVQVEHSREGSCRQERIRWLLVNRKLRTRICESVSKKSANLLGHAVSKVQQRKVVISYPELHGMNANA